MRPGMQAHEIQIRSLLNEINPIRSLMSQWNHLASDLLLVNASCMARRRNEINLIRSLMSRWNQCGHVLDVLLSAWHQWNQCLDVLVSAWHAGAMRLI